MFMFWCEVLFGLQVCSCCHHAFLRFPVLLVKIVLHCCIAFSAVRHACRHTLCDWSTVPETCLVCIYGNEAGLN